MEHSVSQLKSYWYSIKLSVFSWLDAILDVVIPLRERAARTRSRTIADMSLVPTSHDLLGATITTLLNYQDSTTRDLIQSLKYDKSGHAASLCAEVIADYVREEIASQKTFSPRNILLIPIPLHLAREHERGFNQIEFVLRSLPREFHDGTCATLAEDALVRTKETKPQTRLPRSERLSNVAGAFEVPSWARVKDTHIFLIDDVTTTGATLVNAATPLKRAGATVSLIALARA